MTDYHLERDEHFSEVVDKAKELYAAKNRDYDNSIDLTFIILEMLGYPGEISYVVRSLDKILRVASLARKTEEERLVKDESMLDTLRDEGVYSFAMYRLLESISGKGIEGFMRDLIVEGTMKRNQNKE